MILGLHHVTATVDTAQADLDFYRDALGLRLVKKTVNFDNHNVYHFYYGDETGTPGTIWTTFPYKGWNVPVGAKGLGQVGVTAFAVPEGSLPFWRSRLAAHRITAAEGSIRFGEPSLVFPDPSGLIIEPAPTPATTASSSLPIANFMFPRVPGSFDNGGWMYFNLNNQGDRVSQNWLTVSLFAEGRFGVESDATSLGNGCSPPSPISTQAPIGPAKNP